MAPTLSVDGSALRIPVIAASSHDTVINGLLAGARGGLDETGVTGCALVRVPSTFEPTVAARLTPRYHAVVALEVVIRVGAAHVEYVCQAATVALTDVSVRTGVPLGFAVLTCDNEQQALDRAGLHGSSEDKGHEAATAAIATAVTLNHMLAEHG